MQLVVDAYTISLKWTIDCGWLRVVICVALRRLLVLFVANDVAPLVLSSVCLMLTNTWQRIGVPQMLSQGLRAEYVLLQAISI